MEYIEQPKVEVKKNAKRNKIIIASSVCALLAGAIAVSYYFLISRVFIEYDNINLYTFSYRYDVEDSLKTVRIDSVKEDKELPKRLRIPNKLNGYPVTEIAANVFAKTNVEEIIFPDSLKIIGDNCFDGCINLSKFNTPRDLIAIGTDAFKDTAWLNDHDDGEVAIGSSLYFYKGELEYPTAILTGSDDPTGYAQVVNADKYTSICSGAFKDQTNLVKASLPNGYTTIYPSTFEGCTNLSEVNLPTSLVTIDDYAFSGCSALLNITLPESLDYVGNFAFYNSAITGELNLSNLSFLGTGAYADCNNISKVTIPDGFDAIPDRLFDGCTSLSEVVLPSDETTTNSKISSIGEAAFRKTAITTFEVPFNTVSIKKEAFSLCPNLTSISVYNNLNGTFKNSYVVDEESQVGSWVKSEGTYQGLVKIEEKVFCDSANFEAIVLVDENKNKLTNENEVRVPLTLVSFGGVNNDSNLFTGTNVSSISFARYLPETKFDADYIDRTYVSIIPPQFATDATKLMNITFDKIKTINRSAFANCTSLTSVYLPDNVEVIDTNAFEGCSSLVDVRLPEGKCSTVTTKLFAGCTSLKTINIPSNFQTIGQEAFLGCSALESINLGDNSQISNIGKAAFKDCVKLASFVIPNTCKAYATDIFSGCTSLVTVNLSNNSYNKKISDNMFENTAVTEIHLSSNYSQIGNNAFKGSKLTSLYIENDKQVITITSSSLAGATMLENIFVPENLLEAYKANAKFADYVSLIKANIA